MSKIANRLIGINRASSSSGGGGASNCGSISFDGTSMCKIDAPILIGTSQDFTIEAFVYRTVENEIYDGIFSIAGFEGDWNASGNGLSLACGNMHIAGIGGVNFSQSVPLNTWTHIALSRNGGTINAYIDGVNVETANSTHAFGTSGYHPAIGEFDSGRHYLSGNVTNLRVCVGVGLYPTEFTPPSAKLSLLADTKLLLLANQSNFLEDETGFNTLTNYGATYSTDTPF